MEARPARQFLVRANSCEERFRLPGQPLGFGVLAPRLPQDGFELDHPSDVHQFAGRAVSLPGLGQQVIARRPVAEKLRDHQTPLAIGRRELLTGGRQLGAGFLQGCDRAAIILGIKQAHAFEPARGGPIDEGMKGSGPRNGLARAAPGLGIPVFLKEDFSLYEVGAEPIARAQRFRVGAPEILQDVERVVHAIRLTVAQVQRRDLQPEAGLVSRDSPGGALHRGSGLRCSGR